MFKRVFSSSMLMSSSLAMRDRSSYSSLDRVTPYPEDIFSRTGPNGVSRVSTARAKTCRRCLVSRMPSVVVCRRER